MTVARLPDSEATPQAEEVLVEVKGRCGLIQLNRPRALNALNLPMIRTIREAIDDFAANNTIATVVISSTRPGVFCAGGDMRWVRDNHLTSDGAEADCFFAEEYALNQRIAEYPKPYVALIDGICMGGGLGLSVHGGHRVVSENLVMAMPEAAIGFFPDIGASYFLNQLPGELGLYIALTGARLSAADAMYCGLANAFVKTADFPSLTEALAISDNPAAVISNQTLGHTPGASALAAARPTIDCCFSGDSLGAIRKRLEHEASPFAIATLEQLDALCPESLSATLALLRENRGSDLHTCLQRELQLARLMPRKANFAEGVRAVLVDKDRKPKWQ